MDKEEIKQRVADFEGKHNFPMSRKEQYDWWIDVISLLLKSEENNIDTKKVLGISYRLLSDMLHVLDETCSALGKAGKTGTRDWILSRSYKYAIQRAMEQSTEVYNGKSIELASLELRELFVNSKYCPETVKRLREVKCRHSSHN